MSMNNNEHSISLMNPRTTIGVLTNTEVLLLEAVGGKRVLRSLLLPAYANELSRLVEHLWQAELTEIWVLPATTLSRTITCADWEQVQRLWDMVVHAQPREPSRPTCALLWPKGSSRRDTRRLVVAFPEHAGWSWEVSDARSLLATVTYLDQMLGRSLCDAPELVAHQLLTDLTNDRSASWPHTSPVDLRRLSASDGTSIPTLESARDLVWMRPLTLVEQRERYLHKYTHLSLSLAAAMGVRLGAGEPQYSANGRAYDGSRPGLWRTSAERAGSVFDGKRLPSCLEGEWMSTPQVQCCRDIGYQVQVQEGYYWQEAHAVLKGWATTLWQAAERLHTQPQFFRHAQARANASHTITRLAELGITILAEAQTTGGWARPDWWASLIGGSRAVLFTHLVRLVRKGTMPVLVVGDALWVVSNDPNPLTAVPGLVMASGFRGYSVGYEAPLSLSPDIREAFRTTQDAGRLALELDTLAREPFP